MLRSLFLVLLLATGSMAADNPLLIGYPPNKIMGFKGLDTRSNAPTLDDGRATDLLNVKLSSAYDLQKRPGASVIIGTLDDYSFDYPAVTGIFDAEFSTGSKILAFVGNKLKYSNSTAWSDVSGTGTITTGQNYLWRCAMALDSAVCTNNQDAPIKVSGTPTHAALATGLSTPMTKAKAVIWFRNYLIFGNTTETSSRATRFRWSNVGTIETFSDDDYVDISSLSGDEIQAFREMYGDLYIVMRKSIWKASLVGGDDVFVFAKLIDGIGAVSPDSVQLVSFPGNKLGIIFLTENKKIYLFNGVTVTDIGERIQPTLDNLSASRLQYSSGVFDGENYYLSVTDGSGSSNDLILVYNTKIEEWSKYDGLNANCFARVKESTSLVKTYFGNYKSFVYWMDNPDNEDDVSGFSGIVDSVSTVTTTTQTGATILLDTMTGTYTGATVRITSGTAAGEEAVVLTSTSTGIVVAGTFVTTPDSTSVYSIGDINSYYKTKWYDLGDAARNKLFRSVYLWSEENSDNSVDVSYSIDYGSSLGSQTINLAPSTSSLWDVALWDTGTWASTGDQFDTAALSGKGRVVQLEFKQSAINETFHLYGFHILADALDRQ